MTRHDQYKKTDADKVYPFLFDYPSELDLARQHKPDVDRGNDGHPEEAKYRLVSLICHKYQDQEAHWKRQASRFTIEEGDYHAFVLKNVNRKKDDKKDHGPVSAVKRMVNVPLPESIKSPFAYRIAPGAEVVVY